MFSQDKKIALISPKRTLWSKNEAIKGFFDQKKDFLRPWYSPPLGLMTIAAATPNEYKIDFIDEDFQPIDFSQEYDIVGISAMTQQVLRAYEIADEFRAWGKTVVMGGIHATVLPDEALTHVDSVIIGEGEKLWRDFLEDFSNGTIKQKYENSSGNSISLDNSPVPRYDLVKPEYLKKNNNFFNMIPIQATRGCPHDCSFCLVSKIYGKRIRKKSIRRILQELTKIKTLFGNQLILFADDNLFVDKEFAKALLREILPMRINWVGQSDISIINDPELLQLAYLSGCLMLLVGFESLNRNSLGSINANQWKMKQVEKYNEAVRIIQQNGIIVHASFVIGFDNDDYSTFEDIKNFTIQNKCAGQFTVLTPIPGSKLYHDLQSQGRLFNDVFWDKCNFFDVVFKLNKMTKEEMENGLIQLYNDVFNSKAFLTRAEYMKNIFKKLPPRWIVSCK